jgi:hypothetical protein
VSILKKKQITKNIGLKKGIKKSSKHMLEISQLFKTKKISIKKN